MRLKIVQAGEQVLRQQARPLSNQEILSPPIQHLIEHMRDTMRDAPGVGLAAPQVGESLQIAVIEDPAEYHKELTAEQLAERERKPVFFHVIINPKIIAVDSTTAEFFEGCLSVSGYSALVARSMKVTVECLNERAEPRRIEASGWYARILQHEIDHLNGIMYIDKMHSRSLTTLENLKRTWKTSTAKDVREKLG